MTVDSLANLSLSESATSFDEIDFLTCARYNELEDLKHWIAIAQETGVDVSQVTSGGGNTALHMAAGNGHEQVLTILIPLFPNPDCINEAGNTPLHWAALNGHLDCVKILLAAGALPTRQNAMKHTPLFEAEQGDHKQVVLALMECCQEGALASTDQQEDEQETVAH